MNMTTVPSDKLKAMQHEIESLKEQVAHLHVARTVDREMALREQLATVTAQRDLLGKILSCQVKLNESEACLVYQDCYEALASLKG